MEGFMHRFQPVDPSESPDDIFDLVIDLDPTVDSRENLESIIAKLFDTYPALFAGRDMPTDPDMDAAIQWAMNDYTPDIKMDLSKSGNNNRGKQNLNDNQIRQNMQRGSPGDFQNGRKQQEPKPRKAPRMEYFSVRVGTSRINSVLDACFHDKDATTTRMYKQLKQIRRVQNEFHVTLMHRASASQNPAYWDKLMKLHETVQKTGSRDGSWEPELGKCNVLLERVVWDDRIMCFVIRLDGNSILQIDGEAGTTTEELQFSSSNLIAHITVGTADANIKPMESNALLQRWVNHGSGGETGINELSVKGNVILEGSVRGVVGRL
jgi:tRNA ligase